MSKKIVDGVLFDTFQSKRIVEVNANTGKCTLYATMRGNFFSIENGIELVPMTKAEALDFMRIHQSQVNPVRFSQILNHFFGVNDKVHDPLKNSKTIATSEGETLYLTYPGHQFYLVTGEKSSIVSQTEAIAWIEKIQGTLTEEELKKIINNHFVTIRTA